MCLLLLSPNQFKIQIDMKKDSCHIMLGTQEVGMILFNQSEKTSTDNDYVPSDDNSSDDNLEHSDI